MLFIDRVILISFILIFLSGCPGTSNDSANQINIEVNLPTTMKPNETNSTATVTLSPNNFTVGNSDRISLSYSDLVSGNGCSSTLTISKLSDLPINGEAQNISIIAPNEQTCTHSLSFSNNTYKINNINGPYSIIVKNKAYISENESGKVKYCDVNLEAINNCTDVISGLNGPSGIVLAEEETKIYIVEDFPQAVKYCDVNSDTISDCLTSDLSSVTTSPSGITLAENETKAYITDLSGDNVIYCTINSGLLSDCISAFSGFTVNPSGITLNANETKAYISLFSSNNIQYCDINPGNISNCDIIEVSNLSNPTAITLTENNTKAYILEVSGFAKYCNVNTGIINNCIEKPLTVTTPAGIALVPE